MLAIQKAIKKIIERYIVNMLPLQAAASAGDTIIQVASTRRLTPGEVIVIYNKPSATVQAEGESHAVTEILGISTLKIDNPLVSSYPLANSYIEKLIGYEPGNETFLEAVYIGEPDPIPRYPAITINAKNRTSEWLTLESTSEKYNIDITVMVTAADYESQYELMHAYVKAIECSLFRSFYPLVEPFDEGELAEDVNATDTIFRTTSDSQIFGCGRLGWIWFESYDFLRENRIKQYLGNGVYETMMPLGKDFIAGDKIIRPHRHIYNTLPATTTYGTINKGSMIKAAQINYQCTEEVRRYVNYIDSLTF